jgi:hypothetical protein
MKTLFVILSLATLVILSSCGKSPDNYVVDTQSNVVFKVNDLNSPSRGRYEYWINYDFSTWAIQTDSSFKIGDQIVFTTMKNYKELSEKSQYVDTLFKKCEQLQSKRQVQFDSLMECNKKIMVYLELCKDQLRLYKELHTINKQK